jgi:ATP-dependent helicase/nuclease subunit B
LSDLEHGGYTGREAVFAVGLDWERVPGGGSQDPVLLDSDRRVLGADLPASAELLRERVYGIAALFARLRGKVTLSYGAWQATEARVVGPSSVLLQALRLSHHDATLTFSDLYRVLGRVVSAVPTPTSSPLDSDDYWMGALGSGAVLRSGVAAVRAAFPELDDGLTASAARRDGQPGAVHGVIEPRPEELDPRRNGRAIVSASRLEALGACPLRYLHASVLRVRPPDDPELDPDAWLDARERGSLLHSVYDAALREAKTAGTKVDDTAFERLALERLAEGIGALKAELPVPGEGTLARETAALEEDVRSFVRMIRHQTPQCAALELRFGLGEDEPVLLGLANGALKLRGAIDRVDQDLAGLHVIDYKTGVPHGYEKGVFNGGRRLQHAVYAHVAETRLQNDVVDGQYHFPTRRGQNQTFTFSRTQLVPVRELLDIMLDGVAEGYFVPTNDPDDCTFCDYAEVCRARRSAWGKTISPLASWSEEHANAGVQPAFSHLKRTRTFED